MKELKTAMAQLEALEEPEAVTVAMEVKVARMVVENGESCLDQLRRAIQSKSLELIEEALAESAYHNIYDEALMRDAINLMMQLGADSRGMFIKINMAIRNGSHEVLDTAMMEVRRVGWTHSALSSPVLTRILGALRVILVPVSRSCRINFMIV